MSSNPRPDMPHPSPAPFPILRFCKVFFHHGPPAGLVPEHFVLAFIGSGLRHCAVSLADGSRFLRLETKTAEAMLLLLPPGAEVAFKWGNRLLVEAFFYHFDCGGLSPDVAEGRYALRFPPGNEAHLSAVLPLPVETLSQLRPLAQTTWENIFGDGEARLAAAWSFPALLSRFLALSAKHYYASAHPADRLRALMDADPAWLKTIGQMAAELDMPVARLRAAFRREYGVGPLEWREDLRCRMALHYIRKTTLPFKAIGERLGMKGRNYLATYIRARTGKTPRALRREARRQGPGNGSPPSGASSAAGRGSRRG